jgi:hypothetical protein
MMRLEDLHPNTAVRGVLSDQIVTVVNVQWFGSMALELTYKAPSGRVANVVFEGPVAGNCGFELVVCQDRRRRFLDTRPA